jgi:hypothetical protein
MSFSSARVVTVIIARKDKAANVAFDRFIN